MIDDLVTLGTEEPYRMFTSRAEHRLLLGCDSVYERLSPRANRLGILDAARVQRIDNRLRRVAAARSALSSEVRPDRSTTEWFATMGMALTEAGSIAKLLQRPDFDLSRFLEESQESGRFSELVASSSILSDEEREGVVNEARYRGYLEKQSREAAKMLEDESVAVPHAFDFRRPGLSREIIEKLERVQPVSLAQASRIPGVTPAAISILRMHLKTNGRRRNTNDQARPVSGPASPVDGQGQPDWS
jgi:tRNA uridine 5-carboxymethylaminomethyl modification enzyme